MLDQVLCNTGLTDTCQKTVKTKLEKRESKWIQRLGTSAPPGLNVQSNVSARDVPLVLPYHVCTKSISSIIKNNFENVEAEADISIISAFRKQPCIKNFVSKTKFTKLPF